MRRLSIFGLICLLFASGWSPVLAAAFCPRARGHDCCATTAAGEEHKQAAHHHGMEMGGAEMPSPEHARDGHDGTAAAIDRKVEDCAHCAAHSGVPTAPAVTFGAPDSSGKEAASAPPQVHRFFIPASLATNLLVSSRPHGPPGVTTPRHVLINVFLI
ncbi:MAG TPA: hypothetical protein VF297_21465 [Pyrinomonadaceae bacterium]